VEGEEAFGRAASAVVAVCAPAHYCWNYYCCACKLGADLDYMNFPCIPDDDIAVAVDVKRPICSLAVDSYP